MLQPGLDGRDRDLSGEIARRHGNTHFRVLRNIYGANFAKGHSNDETLTSVLHDLDETSLSYLVKNHEDGTLVSRIDKAY